MARVCCLFLILSASVGSVSGQNATAQNATAQNATAPVGNLLELAEKNGFTILAAAVKAAGLESALTGDGPLTIMAPTDAAFEAAFKALGITADEALANPKLGDILTYHAVSGNVMAADVKDGMEVATVQGENFTINIKDGTPTITGGDILPAAKVVDTDIMASNGVVHVIDQMLVPPTISAELKAQMGMNIVDLAKSQEDFTTLVAAIQAAGLAEALNADTFTIMAPTNAAFAAAFEALGITAEEALANPFLGDILKYHAVSGKVMAADVKDGMEVATVQGEKFTINIKDGTPTITGGDILPAAKVIGTDVEATNGVVHIIDMLLIPPTISDALKAGATATTTSAPAPSTDGGSEADQASGKAVAGLGLLLGVLGFFAVMNLA